jgi:2-polyprenyl-3-methyl-5-hydroxy-6-metoxy-1,4-benzoquinol methylase
MNPGQLAENLRLSDDGLWIADTRGAVSYPEDGSSRCLEFEDASFWFHHRNRCILSMIRRFHRGGTIWDIGGGNGFVSYGLLASGLDVALVEPDAAGARHARERGIGTVVCSTLEDAGFHPHCFDAAGLFDVLEHIENDAALLDDLRRYLKPGGHLFATVPAYRWLWSNNDRFSGHFRRYSAGGIARRLRACGFQVRYATYFFQPLVVPIFLFRTLPGLGRRSGVPDLRTTIREHVRAPGLADSVLRRLLDREWRSIERGKRLSFGSSILLAAAVPA